MVRTNTNQNYSAGDTITWSKNELEYTPKRVKKQKPKIVKRKPSTHTKQSTKPSALKKSFNTIRNGAYGLGLITTFGFFGGHEAILDYVEEKTPNKVEELANDNLEIKINKNESVTKNTIEKISADYIAQKAPSPKELDKIIRNMNLDPYKNVMYWDSTITKIEKKYNIQQGVLAGVTMQESSAHPLRLNQKNEGSGGLVMPMPGTAKELKLKVYGNARSVRSDTIHGKKLRKLVEENNKTYSKLRKIDERFDIEKSLDAGAQYLLKQKKRYGTWGKAIFAYNRGNARNYNPNITYVQRVRNYQLKYLETKKDLNLNVDEKLIKDLKSITK